MPTSRKFVDSFLHSYHIQRARVYPNGKLRTVESCTRKPKIQKNWPNPSIPNENLEEYVPETHIFNFKTQPSKPAKTENFWENCRVSVFLRTGMNEFKSPGVTTFLSLLTGEQNKDRF